MNKFAMNSPLSRQGWARGKSSVRRAMVAACVATVAYFSMGGAFAQSGGKKGKTEPGPEPLVEIEKLRAEFNERLKNQEAAAKDREEVLREEHAAALDAVRDDAAKRMASERNERQSEVLRLQQALEESAAHADARERNAPPAVKASSAGVSLYGYVQADYQIRQSSEDQLVSGSGQPLNQDRFLVRRGRLGLTMERTYGEGRIEIDGNTVNGPAFRLVDVEASAKWPGQGENVPPVVMGTIGMFRIPFGREVPQDDRDRLFMERTTLAQALFPGQYDLGVRVGGGWRFVRYVLAVQNGQPLESNPFAGLDPNHQKDVMGRLGVENSVEQMDFAAGVSGLRGTGFHSGAVATKPTVQWNDADENGSVSSTELTGAPGQSAGPSSTFTRFAFGADVAISKRFSPRLKTSLAAELVLAQDLDRGVFPADPKGILGRSMREIGYYVALTQEFGRWQLGVRYDYYNPDQDSSKNAKGSPVPTDVSYSTVAVAAACVAPWGRLILEYDHNRNHLGIDSTGMPANLSDDAVVVRGEVRF
jgi:hypothetical protein